MHPRYRTASLWAAAATLAAATAASHAANVTWIGGSTAGSWSDPTKWSTGAVPAAGDNVWIDQGDFTSAKVTLATSIGDVALVTVDRNDTLNVSATGQWNPAASMVIDGHLNLNSPATGISYAGSGTAYLGGASTGTVASSFAGQMLLAAPAGGLTIGTALTIQGPVKQVAGSGPIANGGILTNDAAGTTTELGADATATFSNTGTVQALNGANLVWNGIDNAGTVNVAGLSTLTVRPLPGSAAPGTFGTINLVSQATLALDYSAPAAPALPAGALNGVNLSTGGTVQFNGQLNNAANTLQLGGTLALSRPAASAYGKGTIVGGTLKNSGFGAGLLIPANSAADLDGVTLNATTEIDSGATLYAHNVSTGPFGGITGRGGTLIMARSDAPASLTPITTPLSISGSLSVVGDIPNLSHLAPASDPAPQINITGDVAIADGGSFVTEIGNGNAFGHAAITGSLDLTRGTDSLEVDRFLNSLPVGSFTILTASDGITGTFDHVTLPAGWTLSYTPTSLVVNTVPEPTALAGLALLGAPSLLRRRRTRRA